MQQTTTALPLSTLETAVIETLAYSDVFDFPLTSAEVWRWLPLAASREAVDTAIDVLTSHGYVTLSSTAGQTYVTLRSREQVTALRDRRRLSSAALRPKAERYGRWIARLPFVRMVAITGSLAVENADADDDLDYLIVTAPNRVWTVRTLTMVIVRLAGLRGAVVCPNYLLAEDHLTLPDRDLYTARELLQMQLIAGATVYQRMLAANAWSCELLPNATPAAATSSEASPSSLRRALEAALRFPPFDRVEAWVLRRKGDELRRGAGPEAVFDSTMCKGHFEDWRQRSRRAIDRIAALLGSAR